MPGRNGTSMLHELLSSVREESSRAPAVHRVGMVAAENEEVLETRRGVIITEVGSTGGA